MGAIYTKTPTWVVEEGSGIHHIFSKCDRLAEEVQQTGKPYKPSMATKAKDKDHICPDCWKKYDGIPQPGDMGEVLYE